MIGEPLFISFINLEMKKVNSYCPLAKIFYQEKENKSPGHISGGVSEIADFTHCICSSLLNKSASVL